MLCSKNFNNLNKNILPKAHISRLFFGIHQIVILAEVFSLSQITVLCTCVQYMLFCVQYTHTLTLCCERGCVIKLEC